MRRLLALLVVLAAPGALAQIALPPAGGGAAPHSEGPADHLPAEMRAEIQASLDASEARLRAEGLFAAPVAQRSRVPLLAWPLRNDNGDPGAHGISNFVDLDPATNSLKDYMCNQRTYDNGDYDHAGIDYFLWPFTWAKMDAEDVKIVAAAPGTILQKRDGNDDRSCTWVDGAQWNAVYVRHDDGSTAWYGHMKKGSLTTAEVGSRVAVGDVLGSVGSSGISSGPHLHFELHDANGNIVEPYTGPCNTGPSGWIAQHDYRDTAINAVATHSAEPGFARCPSTQESPRFRDAFDPGETLFVAAYYRDQEAGDNTLYQILDANGETFRSWTHRSPDTYNASYWYWSYRIPEVVAQGEWTFRATLNGQVAEHTFTVGTPPVAADAAPEAGYTVSPLAPNPALGVTRFSVAAEASQVIRVRLLDALGREVAQGFHGPLVAGLERQLEIDTSALPAGAYLVQVEGETFRVVRSLTLGR